MRESVGSALRAKSLQAQEYECAVDRVAALGAAGLVSHVGVELWRLKYAQDQTSFARALLAIMKSTEGWFNRKTHLPVLIRVAIVRHALREYLDENCGQCRGAGELKSEDNGLLIVCPACVGSRVKTYTDKERADGIGIDIEVYRKECIHPLSHIQDVITTQDSIVASQVRIKLEKDS